jgi:hypothetical protein
MDDTRDGPALRLKKEFAHPVYCVRARVKVNDPAGVFGSLTHSCFRDGSRFSQEFPHLANSDGGVTIAFKHRHISETLTRARVPPSEGGDSPLTSSRQLDHDD